MRARWCMYAAAFGKGSLASALILLRGVTGGLQKLSKTIHPVAEGPFDNP